MRGTPQHVYQVLTKRAERLVEYTRTNPWLGHAKHIWLGVSVEDRKYGLPRVDLLRQATGAVKFLSVEPLLESLGPVDLTGIDWVIVGGESGPHARPMHPDWARDVRDRCVAAGVPFFFKQWGEFSADGVRRRKKHSGRMLDGRTWDEFPCGLEPELVQHQHDDAAEREKADRTTIPDSPNNQVKTKMNNNTPAAAASSSVPEAPKTTAAPTAPWLPEGMQMVPIALIDPHPQNPRIRKDAALVRRITEELRHLGEFPVQYAPTGRWKKEGRLELVIGHRRTEGAAGARFAAIPVWIVTWSDEKVLEVLATSNDQGSLSALELAVHSLVVAPARGRKNGGLKAYASRWQLADSTLARYRKGATVFVALRNSGTSEKILIRCCDKIEHLARIHSASPDQWGPLVVSCVEEDWTIRRTHEAVATLRAREPNEASEPSKPHRGVDDGKQSTTAAPEANTSPPPGQMGRHSSPRKLPVVEAPIEEQTLVSEFRAICVRLAERWPTIPPSQANWIVKTVLSESPGDNQAAVLQLDFVERVAAVRKEAIEAGDAGEKIANDIGELLRTCAGKLASRQVEALERRMALVRSGDSDGQ